MNNSPTDTSTASSRMLELQAQIDHASSPPARLEALLELIEYLDLTLQDYEQQDVLIDQAHALALELGDEQRLMVTWYFRARWHFYQGDYAKSIVQLKPVQDLARKFDDVVLEFRSMLITAQVQAMIGNYDEALNIYMRYFQHMRFNASSTLSQHSGIVRANLGVLYMRLERWDKALAEIKFAIQIMLETNLPDRHKHIVNNHENLSFIYHRINDGVNALAFAEQAIAYAESNGLPVPNSAWMLLGKAHQLLGHFDLAHKFLEQARGSNTGMQGDLWFGYIDYSLGDLYAENNHPEAALAAYQNALDTFTRMTNAPELAFVHERLYVFYKQQADFARALEHHELYYAMSKQAFDEKTDVRLKTIQALHDLETLTLERQLEVERNQALERELAERETLIADLDAYARTVAHDLKNPLGRMSLSAQYLLELAQLDTLATDELQRILHILLRSVDQAVSIVDALLDLAQARRQDFEATVIDMDSIAAAALNSLSEAIQARGAQVESDPLPPALGESRWLEQVLVNLISNALKYGGSTPRVWITAQTDHTHVRYTVRDNGDGVTPSEQKRLFKTFSRLERHAHQPDGHGVGLTIVKTVIERLGGQIWVESSGVHGEGSAFHFTLPHPNLCKITKPYQ